MDGVAGQSGTHHARGREAGGSDAVVTGYSFCKDTAATENRVRLHARGRAGASFRKLSQELSQAKPAKTHSFRRNRSFRSGGGVFFGFAAEP